MRNRVFQTKEQVKSSPTKARSGIALMIKDYRLKVRITVKVTSALQAARKECATCKASVLTAGFGSIRDQHFAFAEHTNPSIAPLVYTTQISHS